MTLNTIYCGLRTDIWQILINEGCVSIAAYDVISRCLSAKVPIFWAAPKTSLAFFLGEFETRARDLNYEDLSIVTPYGFLEIFNRKIELYLSPLLSPSEIEHLELLALRQHRLHPEMSIAYFSKLFCQHFRLFVSFDDRSQLIRFSEMSYDAERIDSTAIFSRAEYCRATGDIPNLFDEIGIPRELLSKE